MTKQVKAITVDDELLEEAKIQAAKENRNLSNFIETIIRLYLKDQNEKEKPGK